MTPTTLKQIKTYTLIALAGVLIWLGVMYYLSFQKVAITFNPQIVDSVTLYKTAGANSFVTVGNPVRTIASGQIFKLRNGSYLLRPAGAKNSNTDVIFEVSGQTIAKNLDFDYSTNYLAQLLTTQQPTIYQTIYASNTSISKLYKANPGFLYHHGEWYGTTLSYIGTDTNSRDTLKIVLHKTGDTWQVVTNPPQIVIAAQKFQSIPASVLRAVNAIDIGVPTINGK